MTRRVAVAGWIGSDNLGDELILRALASRIRAGGAEPVAVSIDPPSTSELHGISTLRHRSPIDTRRLARSLAGLDGLILSGGLIQNETSPWNLPFHGARLWAGRRLPAAAIGLGVGRVTGRPAGGLARRMVGRMDHLVVRDHASADRLLAWGLTGVRVGADPVLAERGAGHHPEDSVCVVLRPPNRRGVGTAAAKAGPPSTGQAATMASALDAVADATGLAIRMVAFQAGRDTPVHEAVADHLRHRVELVTPELETVLEEVGRSRLVITMRYHGAIAALVHGRAAVLLDYSPKMASLAGEGGQWAPLLTELDPEPDRMVRASGAALEVADRAEVARDALRARLSENDAALDRLLA